MREFRTNRNSRIHFIEMSKVYFFILNTLIPVQLSLLCNICPQNPNLNRGDWNDLEEKSRQWAKKYGAVYIACGPIYDTKRPKRIGNNKVAVPHAFYKVILINDKKNPQAIGFIFPNSAGHKPLKKYIVTVDSVEKRTNIDFFPALPDEVENRIEAERVQELP